MCEKPKINKQMSVWPLWDGHSIFSLFFCGLQGRNVRKRKNFGELATRRRQRERGLVRREKRCVRGRRGLREVLRRGRLCRRWPDWPDQTRSRSQIRGGDLWTRLRDAGFFFFFDFFFKETIYWNIFSLKNFLKTSIFPLSFCSKTQKYLKKFVSEIFPKLQISKKIYLFLKTKKKILKKVIWDWREKLPRQRCRACFIQTVKFKRTGTWCLQTV